MAEHIATSVETSKLQRSRHFRLWAIFATLLVILGIVGSTLGAMALARSADQRTHKAFVTTAAEIAATVKLAIQHEQDLVLSTESYLIGNPTPTQAQFNNWSQSVGVLQRYPELQALGVRIAIDDFGTGYSSLGYLQQFPVDCLKIDKSFTNTITNSSESKALMKTFIQLGRDLGLTTLAEGVETVGQMDLLRESHVAEVQGFLFFRPLQPDVLESQILEPLRTTEVNQPPFKN